VQPSVLLFLNYLEVIYKVNLKTKETGFLIH
jgi:hypothetical protein